MSSVLFLATEWNEGQGGLNAINRDLATHCGIISEGKYRMCCAVLDATDVEIASAQNDGVKLISLRQALGITDFSEETLPRLVTLLGAPENRCDYIVGHDIFTGSVAVALATLLDAWSVVLIHSSYGAYKSIQDRGVADRLLEKEKLQESIVRGADYVFGVGPLLTEAAEDLDGSDDPKRRRRIRTFSPGLPKIPAQRIQHRFRAFTFGRYDKRTEPLKQQHLAVAAFAAFVADHAQDTSTKSLHLVGLPQDPAERLRYQGELEALVQEYAGGAVNLLGQEFLPRTEVWDLLSKSSLGMMLSLHEGFGLAGWETIAAGVPLLVSTNSGLCQFLDKHFDDRESCYYKVTVRGRNDGQLNEGDVREIRHMLRRIYSDRARIRRRARLLRDDVMERYSWERRARAFLRMLAPRAFRFSHRKRKLRGDTGS